MVKDNMSLCLTYARVMCEEISRGGGTHHAHRAQRLQPPQNQKNAEWPLSWFHAFHLPALSRSRGRMPVYLGGHRTLRVALWTLGPSCGGLCNSARWCELHVGASLRLGLRLAEQTEEG